jgi:WD40 repeat protein
MNDHSIVLWSIRTGAKVQTLSGHADDINAIALSQDGRILASASMDNTIRLWNVESGIVAHIINESARLLALSPDGMLLVSIRDEDMELWDTSTGIKLATVATQWINNITFSTDGRYIVTGGGDGVVRVWGVTNR